MIKKALHACAKQTVIGFQAYKCTAAHNVLRSPFLVLFFSSTTWYDLCSLFYAALVILFGEDRHRAGGGVLADLVLEAFR